MDIIQTPARELGESAQHVENVVRLLDEGNTLPFIARYHDNMNGKQIQWETANFTPRPISCLSSQSAVKAVLTFRSGRLSHFRNQFQPAYFLKFSACSRTSL